MTSAARAVTVVAASLATFLVILTLLAAQMRTGHDPAISNAAVVARSHGGGNVVTRTSGGSVTTTPAGKASSHPVVTRTSGGAERDDD